MFGKKRELSGYTEKQKDYCCEVKKWRNNITRIDRGLAKLKEARYWRMQNDFSANEKLPQEGAIKKTCFRSYSVMVWSRRRNCVHRYDFLKCSKLTQRECVCWRDNLAWAQYNNILKNLNISSIYKAKIADKYCKSQTIAVCKSISILIIKLKRTNCSSRD